MKGFQNMCTVLTVIGKVESIDHKQRWEQLAFKPKEASDNPMKSCRGNQKNSRSYQIGTYLPAGT